MLNADKVNTINKVKNAVMVLNHLKWQYHIDGKDADKIDNALDQLTDVLETLCEDLVNAD